MTHWWVIIEILLFFLNCELFCFNLTFYVCCDIIHGWVMAYSLLLFRDPPVGHNVKFTIFKNPLNFFAFLVIALQENNLKLKSQRAC